MALLVATWAQPKTAGADAYPLHAVKGIADSLKPNVLVVLETAQSMQDLPGENAARYNEVGADCEDGSRNCRLNGQVGRWDFSGMGSQGMKFGDPNASCTRTVTNTNTDTVTLTLNPTSTRTTTATATTNVTGTQTGTQTNTNTNTNSNTITITGTGTNTQTNTQTQTTTQTGTSTTTNTATNTQTQTQTGTNTNTVTNTNTNTVTNTGTNTNTTTNTGTSTTTTTATNTGTSTKTNTNTNTITNSVTSTTTSTTTGTTTTTASSTATNVTTNTVTNTNTATGTATNTLTNTTTNTATRTNTSTNTTTASSTSTATVTTTTSNTSTVTNSSTGTSTSTTTGTFTATTTNTVTNTNTSTNYSTATSVGTQTLNVASTNTTTNTTTVTNVSTNSATNTNTNTNTTTNTQTGTNTVTATLTNTNTAYTTSPITSTFTDTVVVTNTLTGTGTGTRTITNTATNITSWAASSLTYNNANTTGYMNSNGTTITPNYAFGAGSVTVGVPAYEDACAGDVHMVVGVGTNTSIGSTYVTNTAASWQTYTFSSAATAAAQTVQVTFDNDYWSGCDRNLHINGVALTNYVTSTGTGTQTSTNTSSTTNTNTATGTSTTPKTNSSTGTRTGAVCSPVSYNAGSIYNSNGSSWGLWSAGYISTNHPFAAGSTTITVMASGDAAFGVAPHMAVSVGGVSIGSTYVIPGPHGSETPYTFVFNASAGSQELRVTFDNDQSDGNGNDRNLYLGTISVSCPESTGTATNTVSATGTTTTTSSATGVLTSTSTSTGTGTATATATGTKTGTWTGTVTTTTSSTGTKTGAICDAVSYSSTTFTTVGGGAGTGQFWSAGYASANYAFSAGNAAVIVEAKGSYASGAFAHFVVTVGGVTIGDMYTSGLSNFSFYQFNFVASAGAQEIRVTFDNDYFDSFGNDRNLFINSIAVACPESTGTTSATATGTNTAATVGTVVNTATGTATGTTTTTSTTSTTSTTTSTGTGTSTATTTSTTTGTLTATGTGTTTTTSTGTATASNAACAPQTLDAKTMVHTDGSSESDGWYLSGASNFLYVTTGVSFVAGPTTVTVVARGDYSSGAWPNMKVSAEGQGNNLYYVDVASTSMTAYSYTFTATANASAGVGVTVNSGSGLHVQSVTISCPAITSTVTSTVTGTGTTTNTATSTGTNTGTGTGTGTGTTTGTASGTTTTTTTNTVSGTGTVTGTVSGTGTLTATSTATATRTNTGTASGTTTVTGTSSGTNSTTTTSTGTATQTTAGTQTSTSTSTGTSTTTATNTVTSSSVNTQTQTITVTDTLTQTQTQTVTSTSTATQVYACGSSGGTDIVDCRTDTPTTNGWCNETSGLNCAVDTTCSVVRGDFCRAISTIDGSRRLRNETCVTSSGSPWGSCKHGVVTANTTCASSGDASCNSALSGDYCTEGQPARMCADTGIWCATNADCPGDATYDVCAPASSRMMTSKRALRRAIADHANKVNFGFMSTYQGKGIGSANVATEIFPYVKLQSCSGLATVTETKLLTRGELEAAGCFTLANGPSSTCTVDYGGNGAVNSGNVGLNQVAYSLVGTSDSRWDIPRGDGSGKSVRLDTSWSSCATSSILPACTFVGQGTGLYEGSYYSFTYKQGTPIPSGGVDGEGSRGHPVYFTTYKGKYYSNGGICYNAVDADRSDIVNDGIYGRPAYTGHPYDYTNEVPVPWGGSTNTAACDATTGATWSSNVVPFLTDTTFGGQSITTAQRTLMTAARLEKASYGGVHAAGSLVPLGCALKNEVVPDRYHSAADYMSTVQTTDATNNSGNTPCWSNNIVLVVDGLSNGPGDYRGAVDCASTACAYNAGTNPSLSGCNCTAIMKAFSLAHSGTPVQTHVVVNAPSTWSARFPYTYAFLWNLALAGSPNFDGRPSFGTTEDEVYRAISDKIAAAAYHFTFTSTSAVAGAATQDPNTSVVTDSNFLYDTSVSYPSWIGNVRAFDTTSTVDLRWDALGTAALGHPTDWTRRRIFFSTTQGVVVQVQIGTNGSITNASTLYSEGLGASSTEAEKIMQWLLGKPELGNPAPLMGSVTSSTPIVVGQAAANGLNGSSAYSKATWKRPQLVYVGGDDGMLHAFFGHVGTKTLNGTTYSGGEEAFAFIPNDMLQVIAKQYAQGKQKLSVDRSDHIFGLAGSPKVKDICIGSTCDQSTGSDWHTILVMPEGPGGNKPFALDISSVIDATTGLTPGNMTLRWSTALSSADIRWDQSLGEGRSVPGFYFAGYSGSRADNRVIFASGYPTETGSSYAKQGLVVVNADASNGTVKQTSDVSSLGAVTCTQKRTVLSDVSVARDYTALGTSQNLMAAFVADTWGNTFEYVPTASDSTKVLTKLYSLGCGQPLYFAPALVQLDRVPKADVSAKHQIYLVQVTNSNQDPDTEAVTADYPPSQMVVTKLDGNVSPPVMVTAYNSLESTGQIIFSLDPSATASKRICIQTTTSGTLNTFTDGYKKANQSCPDANGEPLPSTARPVGTPTAVLRADGLGFQIITGWYDPAVRSNNCSSGNTFNYGKSYVTVHEFGADGTWYQLAGVAVDNAVLTGTAFIGTGLFVDGINAASTPQSININETFSSVQQSSNSTGAERYSRTSWSEQMYY